MSLKFHSVVNAKSVDDECVVLKALTDTNLKGYAIVDRTFNDNEQISNEFRHIFIFPDLDVKKGDYVKLFTGEGEYEHVENKGNTFNHKFYWQSGNHVWNDNGKDRASLIKYRHVDSIDVEGL